MQERDPCCHIGVRECCGGCPFALPGAIVQIAPRRCEPRWHLAVEHGVIGCVDLLHQERDDCCIRVQVVDACEPGKPIRPLEDAEPEAVPSEGIRGCHDMSPPILRAQYAQRRGFHLNCCRVGEHAPHERAALLLEPAVISVVPAQMCCHHMTHDPQITLA